jgi:xanthine/CO dehydrogenase XdhC/CoxF family maturation factor
LPIGSNTPDEIAVSVSAQLLQLRPEAGKMVREA